jgi:RNA-directed DNA polymerase
MNLATPSSVQKLQKALHDKAKGAPSFRFYALYDKVYRRDVLAHAYQCCRANGGAAGVDGQSFEDIEEYGVERWLDELTEELKSRTYRPQPVRRVWIPKPDGKQRPLGVPTASPNCTGAQIAFRMGGGPPSVPSASRPALPGFESAPNRRY